jgi:NAD-dependent SIR2 family protein deacetylase
MVTNRQSSQVILFLGAGASIAAGVPDTYSFVTEFMNNIRDPNKRETIKKVVQVLKDWVGNPLEGQVYNVAL